MKKKDEEKDPNWKHGEYVGPSNIKPFTDIRAYNEYAMALAKKKKDFLLFSEWREQQGLNK